MWKIRRIEAKYFMQIKESVIDFPENKDFFTITGSNGFGKTTILELISYGFREKCMRIGKVNKEELVNIAYPNEKAEIVLFLENKREEKLAEIRRIIGKSSSRLLQIKNFEEVVEERYVLQDDVQKRIGQMGIPLDFFEFAAIIPQERVNQFINEGESGIQKFLKQITEDKLKEIADIKDTAKQELDEERAKGTELTRKIEQYLLMEPEKKLEIKKEEYKELLQLIELEQLKNENKRRYVEKIVKVWELLKKYEEIKEILKNINIEIMTLEEKSKIEKKVTEIKTKILPHYLKYNNEVEKNNELANSKNKKEQYLIAKKIEIDITEKEFIKVKEENNNLRDTMKKEEEKYLKRGVIENELRESLAKIDKEEERILEDRKNKEKLEENCAKLDKEQIKNHNNLEILLRESKNCKLELGDEEKRVNSNNELFIRVKEITQHLEHKKEMCKLKEIEIKRYTEECNKVTEKREKLKIKMFELEKEIKNIELEKITSEEQLKDIKKRIDSYKKIVENEKLKNIKNNIIKAIKEEELENCPICNTALQGKRIDINIFDEIKVKNTETEVEKYEAEKSSIEKYFGERAGKILGIEQQIVDYQKEEEFLKYELEEREEHKKELKGQYEELLKKRNELGLELKENGFNNKEEIEKFINTISEVKENVKLLKDKDTEIMGKIKVLENNILRTDRTRKELIEEKNKIVDGMDKKINIVKEYWNYLTKYGIKNIDEIKFYLNENRRIEELIKKKVLEINKGEKEEILLQANLKNFKNSVAEYAEEMRKIELDLIESTKNINTLRDYYEEGLMQANVSEEEFFNLKELEISNALETLNYKIGERERLGSELNTIKENSELIELDREGLLDKLDSEIDKNRIEIAEAESLIYQLQNKKGRMESDIDNLELLIEEYLSLISQKKIHDVDAAIIETFYNTVLEKNFQRFVLSYYLEEIVINAANRILPDFFDGRFELRADDSLGIFAIDHFNGDAKINLALLSGAQRVTVSQSIGFGMAETFPNLGFYFVDEGFTSLSAEHLKVAYENLKRFSATNKQIGIITHDERFSSYFENRLKVKEGCMIEWEE